MQMLQGAGYFFKPVKNSWYCKLPMMVMDQMDLSTGMDRDGIICEKEQKN